MRKKEETKDLKSYVKERHVLSPADKSCQFKGNGDERFCRATSQKTCENCRFYSPTIGTVLSEDYKTIVDKDKALEALRKDNAKLSSEHYKLMSEHSEIILLLTDRIAPDWYILEEIVRILRK